MSKYHGQSGEQILATIKADLAKTSQTIRTNKGRRDVPADYRRLTRTESVTEAKRNHAESQVAFSAWMREKAEEARRTISAETVGSPAEETAKLRREVETQRLIATAQATDARTGAQVLRTGDRPVTNAAVRALAEKAERLFLDTDNYESALAHAMAAEALGVNAAKVREAAQRMIDSRDPEKAAAYRTLETVERAAAVFTMTANAGLVDALQAAADEARDLGDDPSTFMRAAAGPSLASKFAAMAVARRDGTDYEAPVGTLASVPAMPDDNRTSAGEIYQANKRAERA